MQVKPKRVFLDANVVIQAGKPPGGPLMSRVIDLAKAGLIQVITTDLTITEVAKKHAENDYEAVKELGRPHLRALAKEHLGVDIPELKKAEIRDKISAKYSISVSNLFESLNAAVLQIDQVKPSIVFDAYAKNTGFFSGEGKKHQFPDAFIFERLKAEAKANGPIVVVSDDSDFATPVESVVDLTLQKSIVDLFTSLGLTVEAPNVDEFLETNLDDLIEAVSREVDDWGLHVGDVEDGEIEESTVENVIILQLLSFGAFEKGNSILAVGRMEISATVSFTHPNWDEAIYDSEDGRLIPFEDQSGEREISFEVDFSMEIGVDDDGEPAQIDTLAFRSKHPLYVDLY